MYEADKSTLTIKSSNLAFRLKAGKEMSINKKVLRILGSPEYILFWRDNAQKVLLVGSVLYETPLSFRISENYYNSKTGFKIGKGQFIQAVMNIAGWNFNMIYTVNGEYIPELSMVAFKLSDAEKLEIGSRMKVVCDK